MEKMREADMHLKEAEAKLLCLQKIRCQGLQDKHKLRTAQHVRDEVRSKAEAQRACLEAARKSMKQTKDQSLESKMQLRSDDAGAPGHAAEVHRLNSLPPEHVSQLKRISSCRGSGQAWQGSLNSKQPRGRTSTRKVDFNAAMAGSAVDPRPCWSWCPVGELDWSHDKVYDHFEDKRSIFELVVELLEAADTKNTNFYVKNVPSLKVVQIGNRRYSLSNRRLFALRKAEEILQKLVGPLQKVFAPIEFVELTSGDAFTTANSGESVKLSRPMKISFERHEHGPRSMSRERIRSLSQARSRSGSNASARVPLQAKPAHAKPQTIGDQRRLSQRVFRCNAQKCTRNAALSCTDRRGQCCKSHCTEQDCPCHGSNLLSDGNSDAGDVSADLGAPTRNSFSALDEQKVGQRRRQRNKIQSSRGGSPERVRSLSRCAGRKRSKGRDFLVLDEKEARRIREGDCHVEVPEGFQPARTSMRVSMDSARVSHFIFGQSPAWDTTTTATTTSATTTTTTTRTTAKTATTTATCCHRVSGRWQVF
ncbi:unnamed protein product [Polarella glacialis]|uniref:Uncharacterized protein n=1 Tax=Polarella glacialis TaxID=89957 RepID=A0A813DFQ4_POLGL|nr:unnamed protein product [Polarella glacialis]